jgi:hypothetical protein
MKLGVAYGRGRAAEFGKTMVFHTSRLRGHLSCSHGVEASTPEMAQDRYGPENPPQELVEGGRQRLCGVCAHWPADLFEMVIVRAAWLEYKYDRAMTEGFAAARLREPGVMRERAMNA